MIRMRVARATGFVMAVVALLLGAALVCCLAPSFAHAEGSANAIVYVKALKGKSFQKVKQGKTAGKTKANAKALSAIKVEKAGKIDGGFTYKLYAKGKTFSGKNANEAGNGKKQGRAISIKATGKVKKNYNVWYRAYVKGYGWASWAKNGKKAGSNIADMTAVQLKLVAKKKKQPETAGAAFLTKSNVYDEWVKKILRDNGEDLDKSLTWISTHVDFAYNGTGRSTIAQTADFDQGRIDSELKAAFKKRSGDCYTYTSLGYLVARELGLDARAVAGTYTSAQSGKVQVFSWLEVVENGVSVIYDVTNRRLGIGPSNPAYALFTAK